MVGKVERAGGQGVHVISSDLGVACNHYARCRSANSSSGGAHTRTSAPGARNRTASATTGPTSPRDPYVDNNTRISHPRFRRFWPRPTILRHDPGLVASPPVRYTLGVERSGYSPFPSSSAVDGQALRGPAYHQNRSPLHHTVRPSQTDTAARSWSPLPMTAIPYRARASLGLRAADNAAEYWRGHRVSPPARPHLRRPGGGPADR
ncbi:hypothetical protein GCM10010517_28520 [Streptosporangium fragile]|uniref:Uncharacterized protein n=1 Tax=Streptosporangium fragile TaxID=46186 RepID=A0ABP6IFR8_9ACTN